MIRNLGAIAGAPPSIEAACSSRPHTRRAAAPRSRTPAARAAPSSPTERLGLNADGERAPAPGRRQLLLALGAAAAWCGPRPASAAAAVNIEQLEAEAAGAYANREFDAAASRLTDILQQQPPPQQQQRFLEMRAQVLVDSKQFDQAIQDFNEALRIAEPTGDAITTARLLAGRGLAQEGLSNWRAALQDYDDAMRYAQLGGESPDAYVLNSIGNCKNSLGMWGEARDDYLAASQLFQQAKGFRGRGGSTTQRLDGAVFAASNAALMLAQLGREEDALREFRAIARRAPGSSDARAALAALLYRSGKVEEAEDVWDYACSNITSGCRRYTETGDGGWLRRVRRWPPRMAEMLQDFLALRNAGSGFGSGGGGAGAGAPA